MKSRKTPRQSRSKVTVEAILEATTHILLKEGIQALTTNHVADRAGVSIGSLYQYFPNKESLVAELIEQHVQKEINSMSAVIEEWQGEINEDLFRKFIQVFIQVHLDEIELTQLLHLQVNSLECRDVLRKASLLFQQITASILAKSLNLNEESKLIQTKAFIVTNTVDSLVQTALVEDASMLSEAIFIDELVQLVCHIFNQSGKA